jgi:hypothetical protein
MIICILNALTNVCENKVIVDDVDDFVPYKAGIKVADRHDGEIGWTLSESGEWQQPTENRWARDQGVRNIRNFRLKKSDKYVTPDYPVTAEKLQEWRTYRQALRDITLQPGFPNTVVWPTQPE